MMKTVHSGQEPTRGVGPIGRAAAAIRRWHRRAALPGDAVACLARDLGVDRHDLAALSAGNGRTQHLLAAMMQRFGVDPAAVATGERAVLRDMQRVCARCPMTRRCRRALAADEDAAACRGFCYNAVTLDALAAGR